MGRGKLLGGEARSQRTDFGTVARPNATARRQSRPVRSAAQTPTNLVWSVDGGHHFGVALLQVRAAVRLVEHSHFAPDPPELVRPPAVRPQPLSAQQVHGRYGGRDKTKTVRISRGLLRPSTSDHRETTAANRRSVITTLIGRAHVVFVVYHRRAARHLSGEKNGNYCGLYKANAPSQGGI